MPGYLKAVYREYDQTTGAIVLEKPLFDPYNTDALSCAQGEVPFQNLSQKAARAKKATCLLGAPAAPTGYSGATARNCSGSSLVVTDLGEYVPGVGGGAIPTVSTLIAANPDVFSPALEWQSGKARLINQASPSVPAGQHLYYWFSGQPPLTALPTDYVLSPGDEVQLMVAVSATPDVANNNWTQKSTVLISVGPAPVV